MSTSRRRLALTIASALVASVIAAVAANTTFFTSIGDQVFPISPPTNAGATPGAIDNMALGNTTPAGATVNLLRLDTGTKTVTAAGTGPATATLNKMSGAITSAALTTAAGAQYVLTLTNSNITAADLVFANVGNGTNTTGQPSVASVTPGAGSVVITVQNIASAGVFNGTIEIDFAVLKN